jgi:hypothetical protein
LSPALPALHHSSPLRMTPPSTPHHRYLSRDERLQVQTLHMVGHSQAFISSVLGITRRQVSYFIAAKQITLKKRSSRLPKLTDAQVDELVHYVRQTRASHQISYLALAVGPFQHWNVTQYSIRHALCSRGYTRRIALAISPLSEQNKRIRLA